MPPRNVLVIFLFLALFIVCRLHLPPAGSSPAVGQLLQQVEDKSLFPVERQSLLQAALNGMIQRLRQRDQYAVYLPPGPAAERSQEDLDNRLMGIGVQFHINSDTHYPQVSKPLPGSPAFKAGVRPDDQIIRVDGKSTRGVGQATFGNWTKGKENTQVEIQILREGSDEPITLTLTRAFVQAETVLGDRRDKQWQWHYLLKDPLIEADEKIAYVKITKFSATTAKEFRTALNVLRKKGAEALILDLRKNPGGRLEQAITISTEFLDKGQAIVKTVDRQEQVVEVALAERDGTIRGLPVVILTNGGSASASEVLAGCLTDHKVATTVGERTHGKGLVQSIIELPDNLGKFHLTTFRYLTPNGRDIDRAAASDEGNWGIAPTKDAVVKLTPDEYSRIYEAQTKRSVPPKGATHPPLDDPQLKKAVEVLRANRLRSVARP